MSTSSRRAPLIESTVNEKPIVIYHRGNRERGTENTVAAFRAIDDTIGPCAVEFDVHLTRDNVPVVIHDFGLYRVFHEDLTVRDHTFAELFLARLGDGTGLPALSHILSIVKPLKLAFINIEIKGDLGLYQEIIERTFDDIDSSGISRERFVISSFDFDLLREVHGYERMMRIGVLIAASEDAKPAVELAEEIGAWSINPSIRMMNDRTMKILTGHRVIPYTINSPGDLKKAMKYDIYGLFTDRPSRIASQLVKNGIRRKT